VNRTRRATLTNERRGDVLVISVVGRLTASGGDIALRDVIDHALAAGERKLVLDFQALQTLDSSGLGELLSATTRIIAADGWFAWAACPRQMMDLLQITHVDVGSVEFHGTVDEAVAAGQPAS
jgi:anti-sigma B factor antagonist